MQAQGRRLSRVADLAAKSSCKAVNGERQGPRASIAGSTVLPSWPLHRRGAKWHRGAKGEHRAARASPGACPWPWRPPRASGTSMKAVPVSMVSPGLTRSRWSRWSRWSRCFRRQGPLRPGKARAPERLVEVSRAWSNVGTSCQTHSETARNKGFQWQSVKLDAPPWTSTVPPWSTTTPLEVSPDERR